MDSGFNVGDRVVGNSLCIGGYQRFRNHIATVCSRGCRDGDRWLQEFRFDSGAIKTMYSRRFDLIDNEGSHIPEDWS